MAILWDDIGNGTMFQGDTGTLKVENLNTDYDWTIYLAIHDKNRKQVGEEQYIQSDYASYVEIDIPKELSDLMTVPHNQKKEIYTYGVKGCRTDGSRKIEDTFFIGEINFEKQNTITVYPRKAQGST